MFWGARSKERWGRGQWGPWGPSGPGRHFGFGGPRARRGDVRAAILALLGERPMHGYEIIQELEARSRGMWRPSAGSIYPTLQLLEDEGLVSGSEAEGRRLFSLTEAGQVEASRKPAGVTPPWEQAAEEGGAPHVRLQQAAVQVVAATRQVAHTGSEDQMARVLEVLGETRRRIYSILGEG